MVPPVVSSEPIGWGTIIIAGIGLLTTIVTSITAVYMAKINTKATQSLRNTEDTKVEARLTTVAAVKTADSLEKVHVAVNSERTATLAIVSALRDEVLALTKQLATSRERERAQTITDAVRAATPTPPPTTTP